MGGMTLRAIALLPALLACGVVQAQAPKCAGDPLSLFGQDISMAVDRAVDLSVYASLCHLGSEAAVRNLSPLGFEIAADGRRYESSAAAAPIAARPCP
jgi:hypothetical protein